MFLTSMIVYAIIMAYTTFATIYLIVFKLTDHTNGGLRFGDNYTNIVVSIMSTIGLYFVMSFLYLDPWHMFTSSGQYFILLPSYICMLQVYAFCNTHDVTWGTKGDNVHHMDLGTARGLGGSKVEVEMPSEQLDIDSGYDASLRNLRDRLEVPTPALSESQMQEDYYRAVRTYVVSIWMVANAILAMGVSEAYGTNLGTNNLYLSILLWSVAALAAFRAIGSTTFAVLNVVQKIAEGKMKFTAGNISSKGSMISGSGSSSSRGKSSQIGGTPSIGDWISELGWTAKRKIGKLMFWRR
jgi:chitin synthase